MTKPVELTDKSKNKSLAYYGICSYTTQYKPVMFITLLRASLPDSRILNNPKNTVASI
jgi:hypothetical protein